jgi:putative hydrolase of the HAD superfamily
MKIGDKQWYQLQYWIDKFQLNVNKDELLEAYEDEIEPYPEVRETLDLLSENYELVVTSNAAREFIEIELDGMGDYFRETFSATSDFRTVKKSPLVYGAVCKELGVKPFEVMHIGDHYNYDYEAPLEAAALMLSSWTEKGMRSGSEVVGDLRGRL